MTKNQDFTPASPELEYRPSAWDAYSDEDIKSLVLSDRPISSTKNIWAFWHSGWDGMRPWRHRNIISWVRRHDPSWQVRLLDLVPGSPRHVKNFLKPELLPEALAQDNMDLGARHSAEHASDMIRLPLLFEYGGVWVDVGTFLLHDLDDICWNALCDPKDPAEFCAVALPMSETDSYPINTFLASLPGNMFLKHWHAIFMTMWNGKTSASGLSRHPLVAGFPHWHFDEVVQKTLGMDVTSEQMNDYLAQLLACVRLLSITDPETGFSGPDYWNHHCRLFTIDQQYPLHEIFGGGANGFNEMRQYELLKLPRIYPIGKEDHEQQAAERLVEGTLLSAITKKLSKGPCTVPMLATLWDDDENADVGPGTWGEYFRWAAVHLVSKRKPNPVRPGSPGVQRIDKAFKMGILEAKDPDDTEMLDIHVANGKLIV